MKMDFKLNQPLQKIEKGSVGIKHAPTLKCV